MTNAKINMKSGHGNNLKILWRASVPLTTTSGNPLLQILELPMKMADLVLAEPQGSVFGGFESCTGLCWTMLEQGNKS